MGCRASPDAHATEKRSTPGIHLRSDVMVHPSSPAPCAMDPPGGSRSGHALPEPVPQRVHLSCPPSDVIPREFAAIAASIAVWGFDACATEALDTSWG